MEHCSAKQVRNFYVLLTGDQNLEFQQNTTALPIAVIVLVAVNNRIETLRPLVPHRLKPSKAFAQDSIYESVPNHALDRTPGKTRWHFALVLVAGAGQRKR